MAKRILLADDSLTIQKVVELTFSDSEYELVCVPNGQRALDKIAERAPDLILADVVMPEKNGYEVCEAIKANPATARIPVVLLSGTFEPFDRDRAERLGCDAIVSKPFDSQQLLRQVEALLSRDPDEIPSASTMAIPTMPAVPPPAPPPAPAAPEKSSTEGFSSEDFTGSIPRPAEVAGGPDLFEEEYGQADVESAIAAFEKSHPEFAYVEDAAATAAMTPGDNGNAPREDDDELEEAGEDAPPPSGTPQLASWLQDGRDSTMAISPASAAPPSMAAPSSAPAPFWVPRQPEPELTPIPFASDDSAARRTKPEPLHADDGPTQQIPLSADYASLARPAGSASGSADRITDETDVSSLESAPEEHTAEIPIVRGPLAPEPAAVAPGVRRPEDPTPVPREIEELAQSTSIGQLKEMLSSVSRPEGSLSDDEIDRLASRVVERLSEKIVREIAWEVIPDVAELLIKQRIRELESGVE